MKIINFIDELHNLSLAFEMLPIYFTTYATNFTRFTTIYCLNNTLFRYFGIIIETQNIINLTQTNLLCFTTPTAKNT
jgi:hypothetical protein